MVIQNTPTTLAIQAQGNLNARRGAWEVHYLVNKLSPRLQGIYSAWLEALSKGALREWNEEAIYQWLSEMSPGQMEAEQRLMVMEIGWLQFLGREFIDLFDEDVQ